MFRTLGLASVFLLIQNVLLGQAFTGSVSGIVTDPSGAVVADVAISVTDLQRNISFKTASNATGFYVSPPLPPGTYRLTAEKAGFRGFTLEPVPLATQQKATFNITLQLGPLSQTVQITAQAQMLGL